MRGAGAGPCLAGVASRANGREGHACGGLVHCCSAGDFSGGEGRSEALPLLKKATPRLSDKQLKFEAAMASVRCAMSLDQVDTTADTLLLLNREYPHNPEDFVRNRSIIFRNGESRGADW